MASARRRPTPELAGLKSARVYSRTAIQMAATMVISGLSPSLSDQGQLAANSNESVGAWRSLVAHTLGVRVVAGSNPAAPTNSSSAARKIR